MQIQTGRFNDNSKASDTKTESKPAVVEKSRKSKSAFRTISEVADELGVQQHVLRFWETKFSQVRPLKRGGGRRYYRPEDVELLKRIHELLYTEGYTIKGVQKLFRQNGKNSVLEGEVGGGAIVTTEAPAVAATAAPAITPESAPVKVSVVKDASILLPEHRSTLESALAELKELKNMVLQG